MPKETGLKKKIKRKNIKSIFKFQKKLKTAKLGYQLGSFFWALIKTSAIDIY